MEIQGTVAVVTGAAGGIGRAVVSQLARQGAKAIAVVDRTACVASTSEEVNASVERMVAVPFNGDVTDPAFRREVYDQMGADYGTVGICVPAAGVTRDELAVRVDRESGLARLYPEEVFRQVVEVNLIAPVYWGLELVGRVAEERHRLGRRRWGPDEPLAGTIVLIGSVSSLGNKGQISYATTKAGLEGAAATLMAEAIFHGVRCAVIHPGFTDTPMVRALGDEYIAKNVLPYTQLGRLIQPDEIADAICFMISNSAVGGQLWADAGWHPPA